MAGRTTPGTTSWRDTPVLLVAPVRDGRRRAVDLPGGAKRAADDPASRPRQRAYDAVEGSGERVRGILKVPAEIEMHAILPIGWPDRKYGKSKRGPVSEITYRDTYGNGW